MRVLALCAGLAAAVPAAAEVVLVKADKVVQGLFCWLEPQGTRPAEETISGIVDLYDKTPAFRWLGDRVPAVPGLSFGLHIDLATPWAGEVRHEVQHPPMGADGRTRQGWSGWIDAGDTSYIGFQFEHDYELVPGPWVFRSWSGDQLLYEASFEVVPGSAMPEIAGACFAADATS